MKRIFTLVAITLVTTAAHAALCTGTQNATTLQACLNNAAAQGVDKVVQINGTWTIATQVIIPEDVTLTGTGWGPSGTVLNVTYGQGVTPATDGMLAAIRLSRNSILQNLSFYEVWQAHDTTNAGNVVGAAVVGLYRNGTNGNTPDRWRVIHVLFGDVYYGVSAALEAGIDNYGEGRIIDSYFTNYTVAMWFDGCYDICKVMDVHANGIGPGGMPPSISTQQTGEFVRVGRVDWFWMDRTYAFGPNYFFHAVPSLVNSQSNGSDFEIRNSGADNCGSGCVKVSSVDFSSHIPYGVNISNSQFVAGNGNINTFGSAVWIRGITDVNITNSQFWGGREYQPVHVQECTNVNLIGNQARDWGGAGSGSDWTYNPTLNVDGCTFFNGYTSCPAFGVTGSSNYVNVGFNLCSNRGPYVLSQPCVSTATSTNVTVVGSSS